MSCSEYFFVGGTIAARCSSVVACSEIARLGITVSPGQPVEHRHQAHGRQRHAPRAHRQALLVVQDAQRLHRRVVVVQRLAHAHQHDVERLVDQVERVGEHAHLRRRSPPSSGCRISPILPVRQNAQPIAQPTCVEMQNVCVGVSGMKTASICRPSARREHEFLGAVLGAIAPDDRRRRDGELTRRARARSDRPRSVISRKIGHAALPDPAEHLARVEARIAVLLEQALRARPAPDRSHPAGLAPMTPP